MGNTVHNTSTRLSMLVWTETVELRAAIPAGMREAIANRLSPAAKALSPSAKTCHHLPRRVNFSSDIWRSTFRRDNDVLRGRHSMSWTGFELCHIEFSKWAESRSDTSDLHLQIGVVGDPQPVTVCHNNQKAWCTMGALRPEDTDGIEAAASRTGLRGVAESVRNRPRPDAQSRQPGGNSQQHDDIRRQWATSFGLPNRASRQSLAGRPMAGSESHPVGRHRYQATYGEHTSPCGKWNPCENTDRTGIAGLKKAL